MSAELVEVSKWLTWDGFPYGTHPVEPPPLELHTLVVFHRWLLGGNADSVTFADYDRDISEYTGWPTTKERRASAEA